MPINKIVFNPADFYIPVPITLGSTLNSNYRFVADIATPPPYYRMASSVIQTFSGGGYRSLQLPNATCAITHRIRNVQTSYVTVFVDAAGLNPASDLVNTTFPEAPHGPIRFDGYPGKCGPWNST